MTFVFLYLQHCIPLVLSISLVNKNAQISSALNIYADLDICLCRKQFIIILFAPAWFPRRQGLDTYKNNIQLAVCSNHISNGLKPWWQWCQIIAPVPSLRIPEEEAAISIPVLRYLVYSTYFIEGLGYSTKPRKIKVINE